MQIDEIYFLQRPVTWPTAFNECVGSSVMFNNGRQEPSVRNIHRAAFSLVALKKIVKNQVFTRKKKIYFGAGSFGCTENWMNCIDLCGGIFQRRQGFSSQNASKDQTFDDVHKCMECTLWMKCSHCVWKPLSIGHDDRHLRNFHHLYVTKFGRILKVLKFSWTHGALKKCFASLQISFQNVEARYVEEYLFFKKKK